MWNPRRFRDLILVALFMTQTGASCRANYGDEIKSSLEDVYKQTFSGYVFRGTPVGSFGVGTMYLNELNNPNSRIETRWLIGHPRTWFVDAVDDTERAELLSRVIVEGSLGSADLQQEITRKLGLEAAVPPIRQILSVGASLNLEKGVTVTLRAASATNRRMNWTEFEDLLAAGKIKDAIQAHVENRDFVIVAADIVLAGYEATVTIDLSQNAELNAGLEALAVASPVIGEGSLEVSISNTQEGTFVVRASEDVVAAVLFKEPPSAITLETGGLDSWGTVSVDNRVLQPLEEILTIVRTQLEQ